MKRITVTGKTYKKKDQIKTAGIRNWDAESKSWSGEIEDGEYAETIRALNKIHGIEIEVEDVEEEKVEYDKGRIMRRAHYIRRQSANAWGLKISEINFGACLKLAWKEAKTGTTIYQPPMFPLENIQVENGRERHVYSFRSREVESCEGGFQDDRF